MNLIHGSNIKRGVLFGMKIKVVLGLMSMLLISTILSLQTASAKDVLINEMNSNPFDKGSIVSGEWKDSAPSGSTSTATWKTAWKYDNTRDYDVSTEYYIAGDYAAQLDLGILKIAHIRDDITNWITKGVFIKDGTTWKKIATTTTNKHIWKLTYKADKTYTLYKDGIVLQSGTVNELPQSQSFNVENIVNNSSVLLNYVRITDNVSNAPLAPTNVTAVAKDNSALLSWDNSDTATSYTVSRSVYQNGPFEEIAKNIKELTYSDASVTAGNTYYYNVKALSESGVSVASNTVSVMFEAPRIPVLDVVIAPEKVTIGDTFTADIALKNIQNIYAEDFTINYDPKLVEYVGFDEVAGYKVYNENKDAIGNLRFIIASKGKEFAINTDTVIVKLKFKAIAAGSVKVDAIKARIADTDKEFDLEVQNVLEDTVLIEKPRFLDVDRSGQYTLLDLSLDAYYFGMASTETNRDIHDADQTEDSQINDDDLIYIVNQIIKNTEYTPNK